MRTRHCSAGSCRHRALAWPLAVLLLGGCATSGGGAGEGAARAAAEGCRVDVIVEFAPYVAAPSSQAFVAELVAGSGYHLRYVRRLGPSHVLQLTGRDATCDDGLALLRREPRVKHLEIDERQYRHMTK